MPAFLAKCAAQMEKREVMLCEGMNNFTDKVKVGILCAEGAIMIIPGPL